MGTTFLTHSVDIIWQAR